MIEVMKDTRRIEQWCSLKLRIIELTSWVASLRTRVDPQQDRPEVMVGHDQVEVAVGGSDRERQKCRSASKPQTFRWMLVLS